MANYAMGDFGRFKFKKPKIKISKKIFKNPIKAIVSPISVITKPITKFAAPVLNPVMKIAAPVLNPVMKTMDKVGLKSVTSLVIPFTGSKPKESVSVEETEVESVAVSESESKPDSIQALTERPTLPASVVREPSSEKSSTSNKSKIGLIVGGVALVGVAAYFTMKD